MSSGPGGRGSFRRVVRRVARVIGRIAMVAVVCVMAFGVWWFKVRPTVAVPERMVVYSIDGRGKFDRGGPYTGEVFHVYPVVGKVEITDEASRREITRALNAGLTSVVMPNKCFWPRHAVRLVRGDETIDLVICFQCNQVGRSDEGWLMSPDLMGDAPRDVLNRYLTRAGVELVPD